MTGYRLTLTARRHLGDILDYSVAQWGQRRAAAYLRDIDRALKALANKQRQPAPCEDYGAGLSFIRAGSHNIYLRYDPASDIYLVIGVLHQSMDPPRHLTAPEKGE